MNIYIIYFVLIGDSGSQYSPLRCNSIDYTGVAWTNSGSLWDDKFYNQVSAFSGRGCCCYALKPYSEVKAEADAVLLMIAKAAADVAKSEADAARYWEARADFDIGWARTCAPITCAFPYFNHTQLEHGIPSAKCNNTPGERAAAKAESDERAAAKTVAAVTTATPAATPASAAATAAGEAASQQVWLAEAAEQLAEAAAADSDCWSESNSGYIDVASLGNVGSITACKAQCLRTHVPVSD